jgi:hypothetical protein
VDVAADKDARDDTVETIRTMEVVISEAFHAESVPSSAPHFFKDAYGVLWSPSAASPRFDLAKAAYEML